MAECTFQPTLLARSGRRDVCESGHGSAAEVPVLVRGLNRHLELQACRVAAMQ